MIKFSLRYLGGQYFFTVDEVDIQNDTVYLIESKHSKNAFLPSIGDIKDGLLKMILYSNLSEVEVNGVKMKCKAVLKLTSEKMNDCLTSEISAWDKAAFLLENDLSQEQVDFVENLMEETNENGFDVKIEKAK